MTRVESLIDCVNCINNSETITNDDADIDAICNRIEEALNNLNGDIWNINYTTGVKVVDISEDESPECECEVIDYEDGERNVDD